MNDDFLATADPRHEARVSIARELSKFYSELSEPETPPFSLGRMLQRIASRQPLEGRERAVTKAAALASGHDHDENRCWLPWGALDRRAMATQPGSAGGYLVGTQTAAPADVLRGWSVVTQAGVQVLPGLRSDVSIPRVADEVTASWLAPGAPLSTPDPTLAEVSMTPRTLGALVHFPLKMLRQSEHAEALIQAQLLRAVGEALDTAFFAGAGGAEPLGLLNVPGIGTQSGTSLAHAGIIAMRKSVLAAGAMEDNLRWVGGVDAQETLSARERASGGGRFLWDDGSILGRPAHATRSAPAAALVAGDFSQAVVGVWGSGLRVDVDPSQHFESAGLVARVLMFVDFGFPRPEAFSLAISIS